MFQKQYIAQRKISRKVCNIEDIEEKVSMVEVAAILHTALDIL